MVRRPPPGMTASFLTTGDVGMTIKPKTPKTAVGSMVSQSPVKAMTTTLKKAGGSLVATVPAKARDALHLEPDAVMTVTVEGNRLILEPALPPRPVYTLDELLAQCDFDVPYSDEEREWLDAPPVGREIL
jgi:antitoxin ChpS